MNLKSNIWDHVREEEEPDDSEDRRGQTSVRPGSSPETVDRKEEPLHANRHGISIKSLFKNRTT